MSRTKRVNKIHHLTVLCLPLFSRLLNNTLPGTFRQEGFSFAWNISGGKEPTALIGCGTSIPKPPQKTNAFRKPLLRNFSLYINFVFDLFFFYSSLPFFFSSSLPFREVQNANFEMPKIQWKTDISAFLSSLSAKR